MNEDVWNALAPKEEEYDPVAAWLAEEGEDPIDVWLEQALEDLDNLEHQYICGTGNDWETNQLVVQLVWWVETDCCDERNRLLIRNDGSVRYTDCIADDYFYNILTDGMNIVKIMNYGK